MTESLALPTEKATESNPPQFRECNIASKLKGGIPPQKRVRHQENKPSEGSGLTK